MSKTNLNELYGALHRLNRQMHRTSHRENHGKGGLYHGQANLLLLILQNNGASQRDLAEQLDVRPSSMTEMLRKLEQSGLIVRKQDNKDQRVMRIYLTGEGEKVAQKMSESKDAFVESLFQGLTEDEQKQLFILTEKLCASLEVAENSYRKEGYQEQGAGHYEYHRHDGHNKHYEHHRHHEHYGHGYHHDHYVKHK
ncbi:MarR family transcriptional regulator [Clostridium sp. MSJ-4]|uniref:MarR family transcriptional regulator n=1 Tax=Clostridium simiarum TaxID=2841506 RepID=A0ABS6EZK0_9CLOT|nr:MarR family transcriptional regulator [Clostridium simiarum]MBU5591651.1 MarR family transcriptional regulator [Clostridium simiarum]